MTKSKPIGKILGIALAVVLVGAMLPLGAFGSQGQAGMSIEELTDDEFILQTETTIDFDPDTLKLGSKGDYVTAYIELPLGYDIGHIDIYSIKLSDTVPALAAPTAIGDHDSDGIPDLMVKFDGAAVQAVVGPGESVQIAVSGEIEGTQFKGVDIIRVIDPHEVDLMARAIPPPDEIPGNSTIQYVTEDSQLVDVTIITGQIIVLFDPIITDHEAQKLITENGGSIIAKIPSIRYYLVSVASGSEMEFINAMREEPGLNLAVPNVPLETCQIEPPDEWEGKSNHFLWHLKEIRADLAWELLDEVSMNEKRIVFIDKLGGFNGLSSGLGDFQGRIVGTIPPEVPLLPSEGHGTTVAAVGAAMGNNGFGNVGVNWKTKISAQWALTVIDVPFEVCTAIAGGADVINLSIGVSLPLVPETAVCGLMQEFYLDPLFGVVNAAKAVAPGKKFVVVQAAGNDGCELVSYISPGYNPKPDNLILVGATFLDGTNLGGSNFGEGIDLAAPGAFNIYYYSTGQVEAEAGTSFATPLVSGAAAMVWAKEPDLTPQQVVQRLKDTAQPFGDLEEQYEGKFGAGILDVYRGLDPEGTSAVLTVSSTNGGFVATPGEGTFLLDAGAVVDLVAETDEGYQFVNWTGDVSTVADVNAVSTTITMNGDYSITASFEAIPPVQYDLTISSTTGGSVTTPGEGTFPYDDGTVVNLVATPASGYQFVNWSGDVDTVADVNAASTNITINDDYSITASFDEYTPSEYTPVVAGGSLHTVGLKADGTVVAVGYNYHGECDVGSWTDIVQVAAGYSHTMGIKAEGTVVAVGRNDYGQCDVGSWTDIVQVAAGVYHTVGVRSDGTVVAVGVNNYGQCNVGSWTNIIQVAARYCHTVGLKADGTVVAVGWNYYGERNVGNWTDIVQVAAGERHTVGLKADGTVVAVGRNEDGECNVGNWTSIVQVAAGRYHTVGVRSDGTVVAVGYNYYGQCNIGSWTDIVQVAAGGLHTVGLESDGTVVAMGRNDYGQCDVDGWNLS